jgi:hypothetical protein
MRLKNSSIGLVLILALLGGGTLSVTPTEAAGASLTGKTCLKKSITKIYQNKKYTCVLKSKKLVWNSGTSITLQPKETPKPKPSLALSPNEKLASEIYAAYQASSKNATYRFEVLTCPNLNKLKSEETIDAYEDALKFWSPYFIPQKPMKWVMFSQLDYDCWLGKVNELEGSAGDTKVWDPKTNILGHCQLSPGAFCGYGTGVKRDGTFIQYNAIGSFYSRAPEPTVVHHESVHFYQMSLQGENITSSKVGSLPPWFIEGQANLIGMSVAYKGLAVSHRNYEIDRLKKKIINAAKMTSEEWVAELKSLDTQHSFVFQNELGYSLGWLALEKPYQIFGIQKMHDLLLAINKGATFEQAVPEVLGVSKEELYKSIGAHLEAEIN